MNELLSPWSTLKAIVEAWYEAQESREMLKAFVNTVLVEVWIDSTLERTEDQILALRDQRPRGLVPKEADVIFASVDTQDNGFWYEIRGFQKGPLLESWQVREGFLPADWFKVHPKDMKDTGPIPITRLLMP